MKTEYLWEPHSVKLTVLQFNGSVATFDCDSNISDAIKMFNQKGYYTGNCCEGHPYKVLSNKNPRKYDNTAYFDGGYISFCSTKDRDMILSKLNEKGDYFSKNTRSKMISVKHSVEWKPFRTMTTDGYKHSVMRYSSMVNIVYMVYKDIWRIILEVARELPYKEICNEH